MGGFPSGQRGQTVNLLATLSKVRILLHPLSLTAKPMWLNFRGIKIACTMETSDARMLALT